MMLRRFGMLSVIGVLALQQVLAASLTLQSRTTQVTLLELYTSEGCSSCPPADRWLSSLADDPRLWRDVVPVAFHVDYWDALGWPDRFASPIYSQRQRRYAQTQLIRTAYTPGFILNGEEWRSWFSHPYLDVKPGISVGSLRLIVSDKQATVIFTPAAGQPANLELHLATLGFGLSSSVNAGENQGRRLVHDFVVLGYEQFPLTQHGAAYEATSELPHPRLAGSRSALAAWVSRTDSLRPLQAVGGWWNAGEQDEGSR